MTVNLYVDFVPVPLCSLIIEKKESDFIETSTSKKRSFFFVRREHSFALGALTGSLAVEDAKGSESMHEILLHGSCLLMQPYF